MIRIIFLLGVLLVTGNSFAQISSGLNEKLSNNNCYLIARGTKSKQHYIGTNFNIKNDSITHIGIGIKINNVLKIYNVNPIRGENALKVESLDSFLNQDDLCYFGIWRIDVSKMELNILRSGLNYLDTAYINFDFDFEISENYQNLYCSEFVWMVMKNVNKKYYYQPIKMDIKNLGLSGILKRDFLEYIPVDYFLLFKNLTFLESWAK